MNRSDIVDLFDIGDWTVRPAIGRLQRPGRRVTVEPRVMDVLVCLARHAGEVVSADRLVAEVWQGAIVSDAPLYQCLAKLRKALDDDAHHPRYIQTVRKRGYRLIAPVELHAGPRRDDIGHAAATARRRLLVALAFLLVTGPFVLLGISDASMTRPTLGTVLERFDSIAVLPFVDMSEKGDQQYFGDGIAEELIHRLATLPGIRVVARTSSFSFRQSTEGAIRIGESLGADVLLEGSVRRSGDRWRITAQLVSTADGYHVWSQVYELTVADTFAIQSRIAASVANYLQTGERAATAIRRAWTANGEAAEAYYLGTYHMHKRRAGALVRAIAYFEKALGHDPGFALAYAGLARAHFLSSDLRYGDVPDEQALASMQASLDSALALNEDIVDVHLLLAGIALDRGAPADAERAALHAISLSPGSADAHQVYAMVLAHTGRSEAALKTSEQAVRLDPLSPVQRMNLATEYVRIGRFDLAVDEVTTAAELDPSWHAPWFGLARLSSVRGELARTVETGRKASTAEGPQARWAPSSGFLVAQAQIDLGDFDGASATLNRIAPRHPWHHWRLANSRVQLLLAQRRDNEAAALLKDRIKSTAATVEVYCAAGLFYAVMGDDRAALAMFDAARQQSVTAMLDDSMLDWGYLPAAQLARVYQASGLRSEATMLLDAGARHLDSKTRDSPGFAAHLYVRASLEALHGNDTAASAALAAAVDAGWRKLWLVERDPVFASWRHRPAYGAIVERMRALIDREKSLLAAAPPDRHSQNAMHDRSIVDP